MDLCWERGRGLNVQFGNLGLMRGASRERYFGHLSDTKMISERLRDGCPTVT